MRHPLAIAVLLIFFISCEKNSKQSSDYKTQFEISGGTQSVDYFNGMIWWENLASDFNELNLVDFGETDAGYPLHLAILADKSCNLYDVQTSDKAVLFINNAIHPGEPDGVDASMMLFRDILLDSNINSLLKNLIVVAVPYYNIGGAINRNKHSRANQNGPEEYGFRGNAQNLDLNRDFIKCDSRNAKSFAQLIHIIDPDLYVETHVSNGADYQYTMTYLPTHLSKLTPPLSKEIQSNLLPFLHRGMVEDNFPMSPYVDLAHTIPDSGIVSFYDSPRYSTGYLATLGIPGFITETHMLKPYKKRVYSTYYFLQNCIEYFMDDAHFESIMAAKENGRKAISEAKFFHPNWVLDTENYDTISFLGYESGYKASEISGSMRLYYDTNSPYKKSIRFYDYLCPVGEVEKPKYYYLRKGFAKAEEMLELNKVTMIPFENDTTLVVQVMYIDSFNTVSYPYESHYMHSKPKVHIEDRAIQFRKGDFMIPMGTDKDEYVMNVLQPEAPDSYFSWNFFDAVLQQKEWYSPYVFEDIAPKYLMNKNLREKFERYKEEDKAFANNPQAQLYFIYRHSPHYERTHNMLPVFLSVN